jgi:hypothetical protein
MERMKDNQQKHLHSGTDVHATDLRQSKIAASTTLTIASENSMMITAPKRLGSDETSVDTVHCKTDQL